MRGSCLVHRRSLKGLAALVELVHLDGVVVSLLIFRHVDNGAGVRRRARGLTENETRNVVGRGTARRRTKERGKVGHETPSTR